MTRTGPQKLAVFLCKFPDDTHEPHPPDFYRDLVANRSTGGVSDYWSAASLGAINLDGTDVFGWRALKQTKADFLNTQTSRAAKVNAGVAAFPEVDRSKYATVVTMYNAIVNDYSYTSSANGVLASPAAMSVSFLAHETGHAFGLEHSFDQSDRKAATWSAPGEYFDRQDIMSALNVDSIDDPRFGARGPLLCAANLDRMGWLPPSRVWTPTGRNSSDTGEIDLVSLGHPEIPGYLAARVGDLYVEFRTDDRWDAGLPRPMVLIHKLIDPNAVVIASDESNYVNDWQPGQTYGASDFELLLHGGLQVRVESFNLTAKKARISVRAVASRPLVAGPVRLLGGVANDGGGILLLNGKVVRIPPRTPFQVLAEQMAEAITAEANVAALTSGLNLGRIAQAVNVRG